MAAPKIIATRAKLNHSAAPPSAPYASKLADVDATTSTADNILTVFGDPRRAFGLFLSVLLLALLLFLFRSYLKNTAKSIFDTLAKPFRDADSEYNVADKVQLLTGEARKDTDLSASEALAVADRIYANISFSGDNEAGIFSALRDIRSSNDWLLVRQQFGVRSWGLFGSGGLDDILTDNLSSSELKQCRSILIANGVNPDLIYF